MKLVYFSSSPRELGRSYLSRKFELQILNISRVIMSEMWKIGLLKNPRKMASYVSFAYINNLYKTIQQNNKAPEKANERLPFVQGKIIVLP